VGFNPRKPEKMKMPVWITLKDVPGEYMSSAMELAESLDPVLGKNRGNPQSIDQKLCVALIAGSPFILQIEVVNPVNGKVSQIAVDYNNLPIRCRYCLATTHLVRERPTLEGKNVGSRKESSREGTGRDHEIARDAEKETEGVGNKATMETGINLGNKGDEVRETLRQSEGRQGVATDRNKDFTTNHEGATKEKQAAGDGKTGQKKNRANSKSSDKGGNTSKRPNPSFRGVRNTVSRSQSRRGANNGTVQGRSSGMEGIPKGLNWEEWLAREQQRGYESSPNTSEFSNLNDLSTAKNIHHEREILRVKEIMERDPYIIKEAERRRALEQARGPEDGHRSSMDLNGLVQTGNIVERQVQPQVTPEALLQSQEEDHLSFP
jgi:hypothetical protein